MGIKTTILYKPSKNSEIKGYQVNADGSIEDMGPKLLALDDDTKVESHFKEAPTISYADYCYWMDVDSPYAIYCYDALTQTWIVRQKGVNRKLEELLQNKSKPELPDSKRH